MQCLFYIVHALGSLTDFFFSDLVTLNAIVLPLKVKEWDSLLWVKDMFLRILESIREKSYIVFQETVECSSDSNLCAGWEFCEDICLGLGRSTHSIKLKTTILPTLRVLWFGLPVPWTGRVEVEVQGLGSGLTYQVFTLSPDLGQLWDSAQDKHAPNFQLFSP